MKEEERRKLIETIQKHARQKREMCRIIQTGGDLESYIKKEGIKIVRPFEIDQSDCAKHVKTIDKS